MAMIPAASWRPGSSTALPGERSAERPSSISGYAASARCLSLLCPLGWLVEGVFTMTFFGAHGIPFPYTVAWTGLSWHALIVAVSGWYALQTALLRSFRSTALISTALGLFWGSWSIFWDTEAPPGSAAAFVTHAFVTTFALIVALRAFHTFHSGSFPAVAHRETAPYRRRPAVFPWRHRRPDQLDRAGHVSATVRADLPGAAPQRGSRDAAGLP